MAGLIPQDFIDDLLNRTDIVDVIGDHVQLRKAGKDYQGLCPFHNEKTPSFTVSQIKQFYHCFGCGANGSAIGFLMDHNHLDFVEAVKELASKAGMQIPETDQTRQNRSNNEPVFNILTEASKFYAKQLRQHPSKTRAVDYLKNRGLSGEIAAVYRIGYAPPGWDNLLTSMDRSPELIPLLLKAGLIVDKGSGKNEKHYYDRFRDRIMFPIHDHKGRVTGFGGRILDKGEPKYLNSPETPVFHKSRELYGLYEARKHCQELTRIIVVEGYMDVVALAQFGINNAVATLGTATTIEHLQRLFRFTHEVVFCFDGDNAGKRAAWKALEISLPLLRESYSVRFLFLPEGEDPDSLVRTKGPDYFGDPANFTSLSDFLFTTLQQQTDLESLEGRARLVDLANPLISKIPQGALKSLMQQELSKLSQLASDEIVRMMPRSPSPVPKKPIQRPRLNSHRHHTRSLVEKAIHILLNHPEIALKVEIPTALYELSDHNMPLMYKLIQLIKNQPEIKTGQILEHWRGTEFIDMLNELISDEKTLSSEAMQAEYSGIIEILKKNLSKQQRSAAIQKAEGKITDQIKNIYKRPEPDQE